MRSRGVGGALPTPHSPDQDYARRQMLESFKEQFKPGERWLFFALHRQVSVLQDFTSETQDSSIRRCNTYKPQTQLLISSTKTG